MIPLIKVNLKFTTRGKGAIINFQQGGLLISGIVSVGSLHSSPKEMQGFEN